MALSANEIRVLHQACAKLKKGPDYRCDDYIPNVLNTVLDFQMQPGPLRNSQEYFAQHHKIKSHRKLKSTLSRYPNTKSGNMRLANDLWGYNHWSRAKFLKKLVECFDERGIRGQESLRRWFTNADFERDVKGKFKIKEHSIGFALFHWMCLRLGVDTVKPDVHVKRFVENAIGRRPSDTDIVTALVDIAQQLPTQEPHESPHF
jgi:hypothetical protein